MNDLNDNDQSTKNVTTKQIYGAVIPQRKPQQLLPSGGAGKILQHMLITKRNKME